MMALQIHENFIIDRISRGNSYEEISAALSNTYGCNPPRGISARSIKRFCNENNISNRISREESLMIVTEAVEQVGIYSCNVYIRPRMKTFFMNQTTKC